MPQLFVHRLVNCATGECWGNYIYHRRSFEHIDRLIAINNPPCGRYQDEYWSPTANRWRRVTSPFDIVEN